MRPAVEPTVIEGSWEEIARLGNRFLGRRVRLMVLPEEPVTDTELAPGEASLATALAGLTGIIHGKEFQPDEARRSYEDVPVFGDYLEQKRREGHL